jgi:small subunit ribosomal protein S1
MSSTGEENKMDNSGQNASKQEGVVAAPMEAPATVGGDSGESKQGRGPIDLAAVRKLRESQQQSVAQRSPQQGGNKDRRPAKGGPGAKGTQGKAAGSEGGKDEDGDNAAREVRKPRDDRKPDFAPKVAVPLKRGPVEEDISAFMSDALLDADLDKMLVGDALYTAGRRLEEGQRMLATVLKVSKENVFFSLGGPDEGIVPMLQFENVPEVGTSMDVMVRAYLQDDGLYELTIPGQAVNATDWSELKEGEIVEARSTGANTGGLEVMVGNIRGFIPISQIAEYRIESAADFVGQKFLAVISEANPQRGNLVLSRRAVLEREKEQKRKERLEKLEIGSIVEGTVRSIKDFGAFVDLGGLDGLIHISQLSWEKVKHPSEVLQEGQKVQVRVEKIDPATGKIGLSYRSLQDHPWVKLSERMPVGSNVKGTVTRLATFGAFVRVATGVEGLVHISELAHHRVQAVGNVVKEGDQVEVKILSIDEDGQKMSLSLKGATPMPESAKTVEAAPEVDEPVREPVLPKRSGPLKGGLGGGGFGDLFKM